MSNPKYLVHIGNGRVFVFNPALAKRKDMQPAQDLDEANRKASAFGGKPIDPIAHRLPNPPQNVTVPDTTPVESKELADQKAENDALRSQLADLQARMAQLDANPANDGEGQTQAQSEGEGDDDTFVISKASKDELEAFAKAEFNVDLDKRKSIDSLRAQVVDLVGAQTEGEGE